MIEKVPFGNTGLDVSRLCFGTLTIGQLQANLSMQDAVMVMSYAWERGINFFDTAELYESQSQIGMLPPSIRHNAVIATKSYAETPEKMKQSVEKSLREMKLDVIPIYLLHEQETALTLKGHRGALDVLLEYKNKGLIRVVGVSTHTVEVTKIVRQIPELECVFSMFNVEGWGIKDGSIEDMEKELEWDYKTSKGTYLMKALAGGKLLHDAKRAIKYCIDFPYAHSVAIGMKHPSEVDWNLELFEGKDPPPLKAIPRKMLVSFWCIGCGTCVKFCPQEAISLSENKAVIDHDKCVVCTYCTGQCPLHCLRVI
ncbi:MAG TPA: aldo/keto reductase [Caldisericia bacterium]|jgi:aryl-alcohol dehydrogenase-like predicted oxidoreductase|nr:MAG: Ferredoxin [bacterium ADurb.Bin132]HNW31557.1 aldo/keto reductase [Caldisericia bacterium]HNY61163.1 aldo/keto reductase [Caldisericia bacterium]HOC79135.1 aldo/keto reductase [Caldisericia bacterium]HOG70173.1 aldo/keto reductase [Caldisericia bacterium]